MRVLSNALKRQAWRLGGPCASCLRWPSSSCSASPVAACSELASLPSAPESPLSPSLPSNVQIASSGLTDTFSWEANGKSYRSRLEKATTEKELSEIYEDLIAKDVPAEALERVHAPLGYDIGSQTVPEIAVSIVAELIAVKHGKTAEPNVAAMSMTYERSDTPPSAMPNVPSSSRRKS